MKSISVWAATLALLLSATGAFAEVPQIGDTYKLTMLRETAKRGDGSSESSSDRDVIVERVIAMRSDGVEFEYTVPGHDQSGIWQFPARVFKPFQGAPQLLNRSELEARLDAWLAAAGASRAACGQMIFTWNAFRIECDPETVLKSIEAFDLSLVGPRDGGPYHETGALAPGVLVRKAAASGGATFAAEMKADPDVVRRERAEIDVIVRELMRKPITLDAALAQRAKETVSGTIQVTFHTDAAGDVVRKTQVTQLETTQPGGRSETETSTQTITRNRLRP